MENEPKGFVFFSSYYEALEQLDTDIRLQLYDAIGEFVFENKEPTFTGVASAIFSLIRPNLTSSITRYQACVENGKKGGAPLGNQNAKKQPKTTEKQPKNNLNKDKDMDMDKNMDMERDKEIENERDMDMEREKENENEKQLFLSLNEIQTFKDAFPNRKLNLDKLSGITIPPNFDMATLIQCIKQSTFLSSAHNMGLASCLKNYDNIICGNYANFTKPQAPAQKESWERQYSFADLDALFDKVEDIEI